MQAVAELLADKAVAVVFAGLLVCLAVQVVKRWCPDWLPPQQSVWQKRLVGAVGAGLATLATAFLSGDLTVGLAVVVFLGVWAVAAGTHDLVPGVRSGEEAVKRYQAKAAQRRSAAGKLP